jgi:aarF domain-containing kinase
MCSSAALAARKLFSTASHSSGSRILQLHLPIQSPLSWWIVGSKSMVCFRQHQPFSLVSWRPKMLRLQQMMQTWRKNFGRLYARHVLELAAASAAALASSSLSRVECARRQARPLDWQNWSRKDWTNDLLSQVGTTKVERFWSALCRVVSLSVLATPLVVMAPLSYVSSTIHEFSWYYGLYAVEQAGPTFIKLLQWATTRQDLFSPEFCQYFGKLRDNTVGHPWRETMQIIQEDLGITIEGNSSVSRSPSKDSIMELQPTPIGSGCIAQVYRGTLLEASGQYPAGTQIAVKVQHPHIWEKVCVDFYLLGKIASFLEGIPYLQLKYLALTDTVRQFRDIMLPQLDLTLEAKHLNRFNRNFSDDEQVSFPKPLSELTTARVLTETFVEGTPIMEYATSTTIPAAVKKELALLGLNTTLRMIFLHDFLHGDLHPGNILVSRTPKSNKLQLHLLDCGLVIEMGPEQHKNLVRVLSAFVQKDGKLAGQLMVDNSSDCQASPMDIELFVNGIQQIVMADADQNFVEKVGEYIADICFLACRHKVKLEAAFINAALAVEIMEGIATALHPDLVVKKEALPLVVKAELMHNISRFKLW